MQHNKETGQSVDVWYGDLPRIGVRSLTDNERKKIRWMILRYRTGSVFFGIVAALLFLTGLIFGAATQNRYRDTSVLVFIACLLLYLSSVGLLSALSLRWERIGQRLRDDTKTGFVNQYHWEEAILEILPVSNRVWRYNNEWVPNYWDKNAQQRTAPVPVEKVAAGLIDPTRVLPERVLTTQEAKELRRYAYDIWRKPLYITPLLAIMIFGIIAGSQNGIAERNPINFWGCTILTVTMIYSIAAGFYTASRYYRDATGGIVIREPGPEGDEETVYERLPRTQLLWTIGGTAAPWRRIQEWRQ
jgi:hypothetical protein